MREERFRMNAATVIVILFALFVGITVHSFIGGFFGALLLYTLLCPFYDFLVRKRVNSTLSASIVVVSALLIIILPFIIALALVIGEIIRVLTDPNFIQETSLMIKSIMAFIIPEIGEDTLREQISNIAGYVATFLINSAGNMWSFIINLFIALFLLYYMLKKGNLFARAHEFLPFSRANSQIFVSKIKDVTYSTIFVGGIIAAGQGALLTIVFLIFGIPGAFLWGFIAAVLSFLPIVGSPLVWVPIAIIQFLHGNIVAGIGITIAGLIISNIDNVLRPVLGQKIARIHPVETLIGVFIGIALFGLIGVFVGPLLLALASVTFSIYKKEYVE
jgi:predicted PurR-regulated permease PerM